MDASGAERKLRTEEVGTFLVRFSTTNPGCFTISKMSPHAISHQRIIHHFGGGFIINNKNFESLELLIHHSAVDLHIVKPCAGSPFTPLFDNTAPKTSGYVSTITPSGSSSHHHHHHRAGH